MDSYILAQKPTKYLIEIIIIIIIFLLNLNLLINKQYYFLTFIVIAFKLLFLINNYASFH